MGGAEWLLALLLQLHHQPGMCIAADAGMHAHVLWG
jgi:hypothetical protein